MNRIDKTKLPAVQRAQKSPSGEGRGDSDNMELNRTATSPARDETYLLAEQLYNLCRGHKLGEIRAAVERLQWWIGEEAIIPSQGTALADVPQQCG